MNWPTVVEKRTDWDKNAVTVTLMIPPPCSFPVPAAGMMIWNLQRYTDEYPDVDAQTVSTQICEAITYTEVTPTCSEAAVPVD